MDASEAAQRIRDGALSSEELVQECLERIRALEPKVQAWQFLDEAHALALLYIFPGIGLWLPSVLYK